jgi:hypothetical protein
MQAGILVIMVGDARPTTNGHTGQPANGLRGKNMPQPNKNAEWIADLITDFVARSPENRLGPDNPEPAFDAPLVGFSSGADPLYDEYVAHIGDFYLTPHMIYQKAFPASPAAKPGDLTVISWILPSTAAVRHEQTSIGTLGAGSVLRRGI